jgi:hypothetical protein
MAAINFTYTHKLSVALLSVKVLRDCLLALTVHIDDMLCVANAAGSRLRSLCQRAEEHGLVCLCYHQALSELAIYYSLLPRAA